MADAQQQLIVSIASDMQRCMNEPDAFGSFVVKIRDACEVYLKRVEEENR